MPSASNAESRATLSQLADEQAALRRVGTLAAREASPVELLAAVAEEVARVLDVEAVGMLRFEPDGKATLVAQSETPWDPPSLGTSFTLEGENVVAAVYRTGKAARLDDWAMATGPVAAIARVVGVRSSVATPIVVEGRLWGTLIAVTSQSEPLAPQTDLRIGEFTELITTAIANAGARDELGRLVQEQAALRRIATLVAEDAAPTTLFSAVAEEVARLFAPAAVTLNRYDGNVSTVLAASGTNFPVGSRWPLDVDSLAARVRATARSVHVPDYTDIAGAAPDEMWEGHPSRSDLGVPIVVDDRLWGVFCVATPELDRNPSDTATRIGRFTELAATAIANSEARDRLRHVLHEQRALRRVAMLVAAGVSSGELFAAVTQEARDVLDVPVVALQRYEPDGMFTMVSIAGVTTFTVGSRWPVEHEGLAGMILASGRPARRQEYATMPGPLGAALRAGGLVSAVGVPIVVDGSVWGFMTAGARPGKPTPDSTEERLARFTELVATAIADSQAREQLAQLASEQAALRRVATLVARGVSPERIFSAVTDEMAQLFDSSQAVVGRFEPDGSAMTIVGVSSGIRGFSIGGRWQLEDYMASTGVYRTGRPARVERSDIEHVSGPMADVLREIGAVSNVGAPIVVEGRQWGFVTVTDTNTRLPANAEDRLEHFAELLGTAVANADSRAELAASRARIIAAGDDARRRIERDLHDGAQQQLVTLAVAFQRAQAKIPSSLDELRADVGRVADGLAAALDELRDLSRGIHPAILTEGGISPALKALGRRSDVRVKLDVGFEHRLPDQVEVAAYYTVSEALTNASKHANAACVWVSLRLDGDLLLLSIRDDGIGGADPSRGSGLTGLRDRIEAFGGRIEIDSPPDSGTRIAVEIPIPGPTASPAT